MTPYERRCQRGVLRTRPPPYVWDAFWDKEDYHAGCYGRP